MFYNILWLKLSHSETSYSEPVKNLNTLMTTDWKSKSKEFWKNKLSPDHYEVCRMGGTERPFTGKFNNHKETGIYTCACCDLELFQSSEKFESGTGWPSFWNVKESQAVIKLEDQSHGMVRTEVRCGRCESHLGHLFPDGPQPTGLRYCINSIALNFKKAP